MKKKNPLFLPHTLFHGGEVMQLQVLFYSEALFRDLVTGNKASD